MPKNKITQAEAAEALKRLSATLDRTIPESSRSSMEGNSIALDLARIVKVNEEAGEMVAKYIGFWALNPRKGQTVRQETEVADEALDLAITALGIAEHFYGNSGASIERLFTKLLAVEQRLQAALATDGKRCDSVLSVRANSKHCTKDSGHDGYHVSDTGIIWSRS